MMSIPFKMQDMDHTLSVRKHNSSLRIMMASNVADELRKKAIEAKKHVGANTPLIKDLDTVANELTEIENNLNKTGILEDEQKEYERKLQWISKFLGTIGIRYGLKDLKDLQEIRYAHERNVVVGKGEQRDEKKKNLV
jgi:hypothetical protein